MTVPVSVILPIHQWHHRVKPAIESILQQTSEAFELLLIHTSDNSELEDRTAAFSRLDNRIKHLSLPTANLPQALNHGIAHSSYDLIARMDSDDLSHPERLDRQIQFLSAKPDLAGCGTGSKVVNNAGTILHTLLPPTTPNETRWRLMMWNPFVHGSMMLRKDAVLRCGGYAEHLHRAQDYDLWTRLSTTGLGGIHDILYTHTCDYSSSYRLDSRQAMTTSSRMLELWSQLDSGLHDIAMHAMAKISGGDTSGRLDLEAAMEKHGPTRELLTAWMWSCWRSPIIPTNTDSRFHHLEATACRLRTEDIQSVWIWGAGDLGKFLLAHRHTLGVPVAGVLDDHRSGTTLGDFSVKHPDTLPTAPNHTTAILIASEVYAEEIWNRASPLRDKGYPIMRFHKPDFTSTMNALS